MKTPFTFVTGVALAASVFLFSGCEKEPTPIKPGSPVTETAKACDPYRSVTGYTALISEINAFSLCDDRACTGNSTTQTLINYVLNNSSGSPFNFTSTQTITTTDQNNVMSQALAWAVANTPTGYFVSSIRYNADLITGPSAAGIDITVTYRMCTGGGGGGS